MQSSAVGEPSQWLCDVDAEGRVALITDDHCQLGLWAEDKAAQLVMWRKGKILGRNLRFQHLELDMVAQLGEQLLIIEVRCRRKNRWQDAVSSVGKTKLDRLYRAGLCAVEAFHWTGLWRFDLITVDVTKTQAHLCWYENLEEEMK